jgi:hypothetical protein
MNQFLEPEQFHVGNSNWRNKKPAVFEPALSNSPSGPRQGDSKVELVKQGVRGALRSKNLRLLLEAATAPEILAMVAEVPLDRFQNMAAGALCTDEMAYHLEQQLELESGWLDKMHSAVPENYLALLANPQRAHDEESSSHTVVEPPQPRPTSNKPAPKTQIKKSPKVLETKATIETPKVSPTPQVSKNSKVEALASPPRTAPVMAGTDNRQQSLLPEVPPQSSNTIPNESNLANPSSQQDNDLAMTTSSELRLSNLNVLLSGKGAKSALARLLSLSPASVTGMLNGVKPLDDDLLHNVTQALKLAPDWFESPRTEADIPAATLKSLSPLVRGASAPPAARRARTDFNQPGADASAGSSQGAPTGESAPANQQAPAQGSEKPTTWPAAGSKVSKLLGLTNPPATQAPSAPAPQSSAAAASPAASAPAHQAPPASAPQAASSVSEPREPIRVAPRAVPEQQRGDSYGAMTAVLSESVLPPIAEALIKTLAQKASSGALSEDKAFELLGTIRTL